MPSFLSLVWNFLKEVAGAIFHDPYVDPNTLPMNKPVTPLVIPVPPPQKPPTPLPAAPKPTELLYNAAFKSIGNDVSPSDVAPDEFGCAESLSHVIRKVYPDFPICLSTIDLNAVLKTSPHFASITAPVTGCVSIFPTKGSSIGHCGVWGSRGWVMSNDSSDGVWRANYTELGWREASAKRGLQVFYYTPK